jgi:hypothetical protein
MQISEAPVILSGTVFQLVPVVNFETKAADGCKVRILSGDGGVEVKLKQDQMHQLPAVGETIAWMVRYAPYSIDGNAGNTIRYVRAVDFGDLDALHTQIAGSDSKATAKA